MLRAQSLLNLSVSFFIVTLSLNAVHAQDAAFGGDSGFLSMPSAETGDMLGGANNQGNVSDVKQISPKANKRLRRFQVSPYAGASATYSDNINLASDDVAGDKEDGMVYNASVGVNTSFQSKRLDAVTGVNLTYITRDNGTDDVVPTGNGAVSAELARNLLFIDAAGSATGLRANAQGATSLSGASNGDYDVYLQGTVSPYLRHQIGNLLVGELRYGYDYGGGTDDQIGEIQSHSYIASLGTSDNAGRLNVNGSVSYSDITNSNDLLIGNSIVETDNDSTQLTTEVSANYALTKKTSLIGQIGYDKVETNDDGYSSDLSGAFYNAGLQYVPNERMRLTGRVGKRNNELYYLVDGNYNLTKRVFIGATAVSQLMTAIPLGFNGLAPGTAFDAVQEGQTLASILNNQNSNLPGQSQFNGLTTDGQNILAGQQNQELFLSRAFNAYLGTTFRNGNAGLTLGYEDRNYNRVQDETVMSASANYTHIINSHISATIEGFYTDLNGTIDNSNQTYGLRLLGNYAINKNINLFASLGRNDRKVEGNSDFDFTEHSISAGISTQF